MTTFSLWNLLPTTAGQKVAWAAGLVVVAATQLALGSDGGRTVAGANASPAQGTTPGFAVRAAAGGPIVAVAAGGLISGYGDGWVGDGVTLSSYDLSSPEYPRKIRQLQMDPGANIRSLGLAENRVYVGTDRGMYVVDTPDGPKVTGRIDTYGPITGITTAGPTECRLTSTCWLVNEHRVYLSDATYGVLVADDSGIVPVVVAGFPVPGGVNGPVALGEGRTGFPPYLLVPGERLTVLSAGAAVAREAELDLGGEVVGVAAFGSTGYASVVGVGVVAIDLHTPDQPRVQHSLAGVPAGRLVGVGNYIWVAGSEVRLLSRLEGPRPVDVFGGPGPYLGLSAAAGAALGRGRLFAAAGGHLSIVDVNTPPSPQVISTIPAVWPMLSVAAAGDHALVAKGAAGLDIVAMETAAPDVAISYAAPGGVFGVVADSGTAYLSTGAGAQVLDVSTPDQPVLGVTFGADWPPTAWIAKSADSIVAAYVDSVLVADLRSGSPVDAGRLTFADLPDWPAGAVIQGVAAVPGAAYLAAGLEGVIVLDLTDPARPRVGRRLGVDGSVTGVAAAGHWMGAAIEDGWAVFDVAQPLAPALEERPKTGVAAHAIAFTGDLMWVADDDGVRQRDLALPGRSERRFRSAKPATKVVATGRGALAEAGSVLYSLEDADVPEVAPSATASAVPTGWPSPTSSAGPTVTASPTREPTPTPDEGRQIWLPWARTQHR